MLSILTNAWRLYRQVSGVCLLFAPRFSSLENTGRRYVGNNSFSLKALFAVKIASLCDTILNLCYTMDIYTTLYIQRTPQRTDPEVLRSKAFSWLSGAETLMVASGFALNFSRPRVTQRLVQFERERLVVRQGGNSLCM
jgi:hypothetical protein